MTWSASCGKSTPRLPRATPADPRRGCFLARFRPKIGVAQRHRLGLISRRFARETSMRGGPLAAVLLCAAQALAWGRGAPAQAQASDAPPLTPQLSPPSLDPSIKPPPPPLEAQTSPPPAVAVREARPSPTLATPAAAP